MRRAWRHCSNCMYHAVAGSAPTSNRKTRCNRRFHSGSDLLVHTSRDSWRHLAIGASFGALLGGSAALGLSPTVQRNNSDCEVGNADLLNLPLESVSKSASWVEILSSQPNLITALKLGQQFPPKGPFSADHWFSSLVKDHHVHELSMLFDPKAQRCFSVTRLSKNICGYRSIVHGGLTAAIFDETFGGLLFALKSQQQLPFWGPAFTAALDVTYISRIAADSTILCTADVESIEGRKIWMRAVMSDGPEGKVYATARALFVAPKPHRLLRDIAKSIAFPRWLRGSGSGS